MANTRKSSASNKKVKALDLLDKHMNQRAVVKSNNSAIATNADADPPNVFEMMKNVWLPPPSNNVYDRSPTPSRNTIPSSPDYYSNISQSKDQIRRNNIGDSSSPMRKSVAFSDKIESSPVQRPLKSSPKRLTPGAKPGKSILKSPKVSPSRNIDNDLTPSDKRKFKNLEQSPNPENTVGSMNPRQIEYWVSGEVHGLLDINSIAEFKSVVEGGLQFLSDEENKVACSRRFEIYATLNNVIPILTSANNSDINNKKIDVIIDNLEAILTVCVPHLSSIQEALLKNSKKDPFISRLYVQIVRFFGSLLTNFKIMGHVKKKRDLQTKLKRVLKLSVDALQHKHTNKVMITAQISLLRDEKFSASYLPASQIQLFLQAIVNMKEITSTNLNCEKLLLLKSFLAKYPKLMSTNLKMWLPAEVLARILIDEEYYSMKVVATCVSILLDLLKKCLDDRKVHTAMAEIEKAKAEDIIPGRYLAKLAQDDHPTFVQKTIGDLLCDKIKFLIQVKNEPKLAMDLWLALTGLIYNKPQKLEELTQPAGLKWLALNNVCFGLEDSQAKNLALKTWRIITYVVCTNVSGDSPSNKNIIKMVLKPFESIEYRNLDPGIRDGIIYIVTGILYITCCDPKAVTPPRFQFFFENLIRPMFFDFLFQSESIHLFEKTQLMLFKLVGGSNTEDQDKRVKRDFNSLRVIASPGVQVKDILPLPQIVISKHWESLLSLSATTLDTKTSNVKFVYPIISTLLRRTPASLQTYENSVKCTNLVIHCISKCIDSKIKPEEIDKISMNLTSSVTKAFGMMLFPQDKATPNYFASLLAVLKRDKKGQLKLLKLFLDASRESIPDIVIYEYFLTLDNTAANNYIANVVGSKLFPPKMPYNLFESLLSIVNSLPTQAVLNNFLDLCTKVNFQVNLLSKLSILSWKDDQIASFVKIYIQKNNGKLDDDLCLLLKDVLPKREQILIELCPMLLKSGYFDLIKNVISGNPSLIRSWSIISDISLTKVLSGDMVSQFLQHLDEYDDDIQLRVLHCAIEYKDFTSILHSYEKVETCLCERKNLDIDALQQRKILINELLDVSFDNHLQSLLNKLIITCVGMQDTEHVADMFVDKEDKVYEMLEANVLASMVNKCGKINTKLVNIVKDCFKSKNVQYNVELISELVGMKKFQIFTICRDDFLQFIFDPESNLSVRDKAKVIENFRSISDQLVSQNNTVIPEIMVKVSSYLPPVDKDYTYELLSCLCLHPKFKNKGYNPVILHLKNWKKGLSSESSVKTPSKSKKMQQYQFYSPIKSRSATPIQTPVREGNKVRDLDITASPEADATSSGNNLSEDTSQNNSRVSGKLKTTITDRTSKPKLQNKGFTDKSETAVVSCESQGTIDLMNKNTTDIPAKGDTDSGSEIEVPVTQTIEEKSALESTNKKSPQEHAEFSPELDPRNDTQSLENETRAHDLDGEVEMTEISEDPEKVAEVLETDNLKETGLSANVSISNSEVQSLQIRDAVKDSYVADSSEQNKENGNISFQNQGPAKVVSKLSPEEKDDETSLENNSHEQITVEPSEQGLAESKVHRRLRSGKVSNAPQETANSPDDFVPVEEASQKDEFLEALTDHVSPEGALLKEVEPISKENTDIQPTSPHEIEETSKLQVQIHEDSATGELEGNRSAKKDTNALRDYEKKQTTGDDEHSLIIEVGPTKQTSEKKEGAVTRVKNESDPKDLRQLFVSGYEGEDSYVDKDTKIIAGIKRNFDDDQNRTVSIVRRFTGADDEMQLRKVRLVDENDTASQVTRIPIFNSLKLKAPSKLHIQKVETAGGKPRIIDMRSIHLLRQSQSTNTPNDITDSQKQTDTDETCGAIVPTLDLSVSAALPLSQAAAQVTGIPSAGIKKGTDALPSTSTDKPVINGNNKRTFEASFEEDDLSREPTPTSADSCKDMKINFPSKKTRRLVSKLHGFNNKDLEMLSCDEKKKLRLELLQFIMKLEE